ncbi:hypothetical protein TNCT_128261 [Trichonephila clavata]|uniref:Uncharacterized protein n=1 Tax=Trichonephila clavata TaxID=2740835 RepID=A0A8X6HPX8_TRICU|nr:hypothetical protein TNCT_128261 [Trichonephila clavata]
MDFDNETTNSRDTGQFKSKCGRKWKFKKWNTQNQAYGNINTGTDPLRFQSRGYRQSHMVRFNERQTSSTINLGSLYNRINIIFARPEIVKISNDRYDN